MALEPWLRSPLLSGGVQTPANNPGDTEWDNFGGRSWGEAWNAEQESRLIRTQGCMTRGWNDKYLPCDGILRSEYPGSVVEERKPHRGGQSGLPPGDEFRLTVRVIQATDIPQGLVLWPNDPCVRSTATVDGRDAGSLKEILNISKPSAAVAKYEIVKANGRESGEQQGKDGNGDDNGAILGFGEIRPEHGERVLELQIRHVLASVEDGEIELCPVLSLRVEVLVGRVATATGEVDLGSLLRASLSKPSSERTVVNFADGGEIVLALGLSRGASSSKSAQEQKQQSYKGETGSIKLPPPPPERSDLCLNSDPIGETAWPEGSQLEHFLDSISSWGRGEDSRYGLNGSNHSVNGSNHKWTPDIFPAAGRSAVGVETEKGLADRSKNQSLSANTALDEAVFPDLVEWLSRSHPDPPFLRKVFEKNGNYAFPNVEAPFLAALLKHAGLVSEAFQAAEMLSASREKGDNFFYGIVPLTGNRCRKGW